MDNMIANSLNLTIRRFTLQDDAFVFELLNTPNWKQYIGERNINSIDDAVAYIQNGPLLSYSILGYGAWVVTLKSTGQAIGMCGLFKRDYLNMPDLGFAFLPGFEGRGFAYEASMATLGYIKQNYPLNKLYATTGNNNLRSQRLLERCGFIRSGDITPPDTETLLLYTLALQ